MRGPRLPHLPPALARRGFWLGVIEAFPAVGGMALGLWVNVPTLDGVCVIAGLAAMLLTCWLLRHQTPPTPIHFEAREPAEATKLSLES